MSERFKLVATRFSEKDKEQQWTYALYFPLIFNEQPISEVTITDHAWKKKGRENITRQLILDLLRERINQKEMEPEPKKNPHWTRDHFVARQVPYQDKKYKLVFWFKDGADNHLWIRTCHEQD